jgi:3-methyladenine DNA glycosylase/8-oxoguanine DNA glycosylase
MRALRQAAALPENDLGLLRVATKWGHGRMRPADLLLMAERWRPLRAYAAMLLWLSEYPRRPSGIEGCGSQADFAPALER